MSAAHLLTRTVSDRHISRVEAAGRTEGQDGAAGKTLGDLLYTNKELHPTENDWVRLVRLIADGDQLALHSLYEQTHRLVFTLIMRITNNRETAEELTVDVFHEDDNGSHHARTT